MCFKARGKINYLNFIRAVGIANKDRFRYADRASLL